MKTCLGKKGSKRPSQTAETGCFNHARREAKKVFRLFFSKKNCLLSIVLLSAPSGAGLAASQSFIVTTDNKPVTRTSRYDPNESFVVDVTFNTDRCGVGYADDTSENEVTAHPDDLDYVPAISSAVTTWNGCLLVEDGGAGHGWRTDQAHIFAIRARRLCHLGIIVPELQAAHSLVEQEVRGNGEFRDLDNQLEFNPFTDHADAGGIVIALKEPAGRLVYGPKWCWQLNGGDEGRKSSNRGLAETQGLEATAAHLLQRAAIDRYCDRPELLVADLGRARTFLPPSQYIVLAGLVRRMTVGKLLKW